jgi:hypothetical protein
MLHGMLDDNVAHSPQVIHMIERGPTGPAITYGFTGSCRMAGSLHRTDKRYLDEAISGFTRADAVAGCTCGGSRRYWRFGDRLCAQASAAWASQSRHCAGTALRCRALSVEISPLVDDLNVYIVENQAIIERARVAAGNLAHSLRTPWPSSPTRPNACPTIRSAMRWATNLLRQCDVMVQQIESSGEGAFCRDGQNLGPDRVCCPTYSRPDGSHAQAAPRQDIRPETSPGNGDKCRGRSGRFVGAPSILLDNAGKWATSNIEIGLEEHGGTVVISLADDGPGMSAQQMVDARDRHEV